MKLALQMASWMFVRGEFRPEIYGSPASLSVEAQHRQLVGAGIDVGLNCKIPTAAYAGNINVIASWLAQLRKICIRNVISAIRIVRCRTQLALKCNAVIARPF